tara:strand:+ start:9 stop:365 length:357 start_codon:yes stop_codon:yes gene_type:complete
VHPILYSERIGNDPGKENTMTQTQSDAITQNDLHILLRMKANKIERGKEKLYILLDDLIRDAQELKKRIKNEPERMEYVAASIGCKAAEVELWKGLLADAIENRKDLETLHQRASQTS